MVLLISAQHLISKIISGNSLFPLSYLHLKIIDQNSEGLTTTLVSTRSLAFSFWC